VFSFRYSISVISNAKVHEDILLPENIIIEQTEEIVESVKNHKTTLTVEIDHFSVKIYIKERTIYEPYLVINSAIENEVIIIINTGHPHWTQLRNAIGVLNYLRHCIYDGIAEWQARHRKQSLRPDTIKTYKDNLLRIPFKLELQELSEFDDFDEINND
jgi:hypothetical protein